MLTKIAAFIIAFDIVASSLMLVFAPAAQSHTDFSASTQPAEIVTVPAVSMPQVVVVGKRLSDAEKLAFDKAARSSAGY